MTTWLTMNAAATVTANDEHKINIESLRRIRITISNARLEVGFRRLANNYNNVLLYMYVCKCDYLYKYIRRSTIDKHTQTQTHIPTQAPSGVKHDWKKKKRNPTWTGPKRMTKNRRWFYTCGFFTRYWSAIMTQNPKSRQRWRTTKKKG